MHVQAVVSVLPKNQVMLHIQHQLVSLLTRRLLIVYLSVLLSNNPKCITNGNMSTWSEEMKGFNCVKSDILVSN